MSNDQYTLNDVTVESAARKGNSVELAYRTTMESMFYSPGIRIEMDNDDMIVNIIRCSIDNECDVDKKATLKEGVSHVIVDAPKGGIYLGKDKSRKVDIN